MNTIIDIPKENEASPNQEKQNKIFFLSTVWYSIEKHREQHAKRIIHSIKVGIALVLVSLLYLLDPVFEQVGESAMWAIMTVVVVYDFFAGATLSKGLLRGVGTILGGGLGCVAAILAEDSGKTGFSIVVGTSVFIFGAAATYCRMIPSIKKKYDYGVMIFILTFNLVAVSGLRADKILQLAQQRLATIGMGFAVCIFTSLLIFPMWAGDELHHLTSSKFNKLACCIEGRVLLFNANNELQNAWKIISGAREKKGQLSMNVSSCKSVLHSKSSDESLIAELLRELASTILSLQACIESPLQPSTTLQQPIKETCKDVGLSLGITMRELGESIMKMRRGQEKVLILPELQFIKLESILSTSELQAIENVETLAIANFLFVLMEIVDKVKVLAKEVEELGDVAGFQSK
ncbi:aluminum-activated malate transporter 13-like protein [Tanacetum coccineum]